MKSEGARTRNQLNGENAHGRIDSQGTHLSDGCYPENINSKCNSIAGGQSDLKAGKDYNRQVSKQDKNGSRHVNTKLIFISQWGNPNESCRETPLPKGGWPSVWEGSLCKLCGGGWKEGCLDVLVSMQTSSHCGKQPGASSKLKTGTLWSNSIRFLICSQWTQRQLVTDPQSGTTTPFTTAKTVLRSGNRCLGWVGWGLQSGRVCSAACVVYLELAKSWSVLTPCKQNNHVGEGHIH